MPGLDALTEKERATLRLMARGHDAKSAAVALGLSVHTINERLRDARRKLGVGSSREAARMLAASEDEKPADKPLGEAPAADDAARAGRPRRAAVIAGATIMSIAVAVVLLAQAAGPGVVATAPPAAAEAPAADAALAWLALVDAGRWDESWAATAASFQSLNTAAAWADASRGGRVPLGAVRSRVLLGAEAVPAPPAGVLVVKYRTSFAAKPDTVETLSLVREGGAWRVVGYYIG